MQSYESHIPYLLQFTSDFNIQPMGWLHLSTAKVTYLAPTLTHSIKDTINTHGVTVLLILMSSLLVPGWSTLTEHRALHAGVSAAQSSVLLSTEPLFATFFAWMLLGESVGGVNVAGAAVFILAASLWGPLAERLLTAIEKREERKAALKME